MNVTQTLTTLYFYPQRNPRLRLFALWYFTTLITVWTVLGHTVFGFEQAWAAPLVGVGAAILTQIFLEWVDACAHARPLRFAGGFKSFFNFLPPAIIPGLAVSMLIYPNERLWPIAFASALSIASKVLFRAPVDKGLQHIFNPSNIGISLTLLLFPWVGLAPPYHFTENISGIWNWVLPGVILVTGIFVHGMFTGRLPLVLAWLAGFALQGLLRSWIFGIPWIVPFVPMTSAAFILFTLYMIPDPATTPLDRRGQIVFGAGVAALYGTLLVTHVVFGLFFALAGVCALRGLGLYIVRALATHRANIDVSVPSSVAPPSVAVGRPEV